MRKQLRYVVVCTILFIGSLGAAMAQTQLSGKITDATTKEPLIGISLQIKGKVTGTISDLKGNFSLNTATPPPFSLIVTGIGYETQEIKVEANRSNFDIVMKEQVLMGQEVVVSASRVEEGVLKSPASVEKMDIRAIREAAAPDFFSALANVKGIDMATQGLLFKSINMRGFGATGNPRTVQMIDGMDNSAPGLNFPIDNIVGMPELDVESVEILPGAASALYGPNAINGLVLMNSKSPFLYQGLSANIKTGIMSADNRATTNTGFYDASIRYAKAFNNKFAFKVNFSYIQAKDWEATNYNNLNSDLKNPAGNADPNRGPGTNLDYNGVNIYGDEVATNMRGVANSLIAAKLLPAAALSLIPNSIVSRTGFLEKDLVDYNTKSFKFNGALHYRLSEKVEAVAQVNYGYGTTVYTGNGRYSLRNFNLTQAKLELKGDNFLVRAYTTQERSGQSYTAGLVGVFMENAWKSNNNWFGQYVGAFAQARGAGQAESAAHATARGVADTGRPVPGTQAYNDLLDKVRNTSIAEGGGAFTDKSNLYHAEGLYNFKNQIKFADVLIGANVRQYQLASDGTLFADKVDGRNGKITINEYGAFIQAAKQIDFLKISGSVRYDKNQNFAGQFTPRVSAVATFGQHNFRVSYQTGFRIPTTQNQYIDLQVPGSGRLIGGLPEFYTRLNLGTAYLPADVSAYGAAVQASAANPATQQQAVAFITQQVTAGVTSAVQAGVAAGQIPNVPAVIQAAIAAGVQAQLPGAIQANISNAVLALAATANVGSLQAKAFKPREFKPERVVNYEIGYRGVINKKLFVDAYYYYSVYKDFIGGLTLIQSRGPAAAGLANETGFLVSNFDGFSMPANSTSDITASGWAIGLNYNLPKSFTLSANIANNKLNNFTPTPELQTAGFNTPTYRWNVGFGNRSVNGSKIGFNINFKHQQSFVWESGFTAPTAASQGLGVQINQNTIVPAISNLDAQMSFKLSSMKSILKVGGSNILGTPYFQAYGNPTVGAMYYVSLTFDELLNK
jgi:iron complex outermembrane recepter protein